MSAKASSNTYGLHECPSLPSTFDRRSLTSFFVFSLLELSLTLKKPVYGSALTQMTDMSYYSTWSRTLTVPQQFAACFVHQLGRHRTLKTTLKGADDTGTGHRTCGGVGDKKCFRHISPDLLLITRQATGTTQE